MDETDDRGAVFTVAEPWRWLTAALSGAAGVVHLAMVPSHMGEWTAEGIAFAAVGWFQLAVAALVLLRPSRRLLQATAVANVAFVAAWVVTRTAGPPFGPHAGQAESASSVDLTTVGLEMVLVLLAVAGLLGLRLPSGAVAGRGAVVGSAAVLLLATVVLTSPSARNHGHGAGDHGAAGQDAAGDHAHGVVQTAAGVSPIEDRGLADLSNGHHHEIVAEELDDETQAELDAQLAVVREVAAEHPTVADAEAAGYQRIGPYFPGIGAHYGKTGPDELNREGVIDERTLSHPFALIYNGTEPTSVIAGFMFLSLADEEPSGFAGPNDVWHYHEQLCLDYQANGEINVPFGLDRQATRAQCESAGARLLDISPWMVHVWAAPGWDDDPDVGTFGEVHTDLTCADGTYFMLPVDQWATHQMNVCQSDPS